VATAIRNEGNLALARQVFNWFTEHDMDSVVSALHPDVEAHPSIDGAPHLHGREEVARWWARLATLNSEVEVRPLHFEARGSCVIVRGYLRRREGRALAESQVHWLFEFRDGQIVRMESHPTRQAALASC
jgi:ketosteroid isomerase-like protein